ncbi:hypothetical protein SELMODRAFT_412800 [Selaginella moellendorffii]|uniref:Pentacotripeptide-repeat region of PRORP domain-containing protein n=1 Tax=Selaginella moellendorffii TaxID=88036 RepID=D8RMC1_SELML|nr:hypothetical protein SELMODRAFT_412800 [Selaginella moellendorffii]
MGRWLSRSWRSVDYGRLDRHEIILSAVLTACNTRNNLEAYGRKFHSWIDEAGWETNALVANALVTMYAACGATESAEELLSRMDVVSWTAVLAGYSQLGRSKDSIRLFKSMLLHGILESGLQADVTVSNSLLNMYCKCGTKLEEAHAHTALLASSSAWDVLSWTTIVATRASSGSPARAMELFRAMQLHGVIPDSITFINTLRLAATLAWWSKPGMSLLGACSLYCDHLRTTLPDALARSPRQCRQLTSLPCPMPLCLHSDQSTIDRIQVFDTLH